MTTLMMAGYERAHAPSRTLWDAAKGANDPYASIVSTRSVRPWDLIGIQASCTIPGAREWADKTLNSIIAAAMDRFKGALDCADCLDLGFYGRVDRSDPDVLTALLRRIGDGGYEQLTASGEWQPYEIVADQRLEILNRELAGDLAEAITAGASGLARRYFWPVAFLPPAPIIASVPANEVLASDVAVDTQDALDTDTAAKEGWVSYAIVDDLDPGAVLDLIRLRRGPAGPELVAFRGGVWVEAPDLLSDLQGVQPPPLVELGADQLASVLEQIGGEGSADSGDPGEGLDEADNTPDRQQEPAKPGVPETEKYLPGKSLLVAAGPSAKERKKAADKGQALPEGGFPIKNRNDLKNAVKDLGRATNQGAAKRHIIKRARALNAIGALPKDWGVTAMGALLADAPLTVSPDPRAEKLRRYWSPGGKGGAKIRWGTPGDWTRCYRQLRKYMGLRAKGYCQNMHKRNTGTWAGDRSNRGGRAASLAAAGTPAAQSMEAALVAAVSTGRWFGPEGGTAMTLKDGIYVEGGTNIALLRTLTAGGFPVNPPDDWFGDPKLDGPTPLTVDDDGRVWGHIATRDVAHIGLPGRVKAPVSKSGYAYFKTGQLVTAGGKKVNVGQLTLAGGHAPLQADAAAAVAHYDNTASAVADVNCGDDSWGIWVAGALRPEVTPAQLRTLRASAPSGDWRPINGNLEMVACCQVNVPGFPIVRARVASGAITSLVAAGAGPLYARRLAIMADASVAERVQALEDAVFTQLTAGLEDPTAVLVADGDGLEGGDPIPAEQAQAEGLDEEDPDGQKPVSDAVKRAREAVAARRAAQGGEAPGAPQETPGQVLNGEAASEKTAQDAAQSHELQVDVHATAADARMAELRARVHGNRKPAVAATAGSPGNS